MTCRRTDYLITDTRISTENEEFSDTIGIKDSEFLRFLNDAQTRIHSLLVQQHPSIFLTEQIENVVADQESYNISYKAFAGNKVAQVEYSPTASDDYYYPLRPTTLYNRDTGAEGSPTHYIRKAGKILLVPTPTSSNGKLRITFTHRLPKMDVQRAIVSSATTSGTSISSLTLNVSTETIDSELSNDTRMTIVDEEGNIKMANIKFTAIDTGTGVVTVDPSFTFESGESISTGDVVLKGRYSTTHSELDEMVERYLISYATMQILKRESNSDLAAQQSILMEMEREIIDAYAEMSDDIFEIQEINDTDEDWFQCHIILINILTILEGLTFVVPT